MKQYFLNRRSIRKFKPVKVDKADISKWLVESSHAPTTGNMQLYSVVVTDSLASVKSLAELHFNQPAAVGAAALLTFCVDFNRFEHWCRISNANVEFGNVQALLMGIMDAMAFAQQFVTIAEMAGMGTCYLGTTTFNAPAISELLQLPPRVYPLITVALGVPDEAPEDCGRLPLEAVMHLETYHSFTDEEIISLYREKEMREDSQHFVAENHKSTLAQVFTDVRYPGSMLKPMSDAIVDYWLKSLK